MPLPNLKEGVVGNKKDIPLQVGEMISLSELTLLLPGEANHNVITPFKRDGLKADISKFGFDEPLQVWENDGKLLGTLGQRGVARLAHGSVGGDVVGKPGGVAKKITESHLAFLWFATDLHLPQGRNVPGSRDVQFQDIRRRLRCQQCASRRVRARDRPNPAPDQRLPGFRGTRP